MISKICFVIAQLRLEFASVLLFFTLISCSPTTGTRILVNRAALTGFQKLGIVVTKEEGFSVRIAREQAPSPGAVILGITGVVGGLAGAIAGVAVGAGVDAAIGRNADTEVTEPFDRHVKAYDPVMVFSEVLLREFTNEQVFPSVVVLLADSKNAAQVSGVDGVLKVSIKQWGLRLCASSGSDTKVQAALFVESRIAATGKSEPLWERDELYLDGECHFVGDLQVNGQLLLTILSRAIESSSGKLVNEIRFP